MNQKQSMAISYHASLKGIPLVSRFFDGWQHRPTQASFEAMLGNSDVVVCAVDDNSNEIVGLALAITDNVLSAYISFLEVYGPYRSKGIGSRLMKIMLNELSGLYAVDLTCDPPLQEFYRTLGMRPSVGMSLRNYSAQEGAAVRGATAAARAQTKSNQAAR
jgi:GNAT superfamily N-acetyltransferase